MPCRPLLFDTNILSWINVIILIFLVSILLFFLNSGHYNISHKEVGLSGERCERRESCKTSRQAIKKGQEDKS